MELDDAAGEGEAEAERTHTAGAVGVLEGVEDFFELGAGDAAAGDLDVDAELVGDVGGDGRRGTCTRHFLAESGRRS